MDGLVLSKFELWYNVNNFLSKVSLIDDIRNIFLDTEDLYTLGFQELASRYGKNFTFELKCQIMGKQSEEFAESIIKALELPLTVEEFLIETRKIFKDLFPLCSVMPGKKKKILIC